MDGAVDEGVSLKELARSRMTEPRFGEEGFVSILDGVEGWVRPPVGGLGRAGDGLPAGVSPRTVHSNGICACGHRVGQHRGGQCFGVPGGNRRHRTREATDCVCADLNPVMIVKDTRAFRKTWASALPEHPFNAAAARQSAGNFVAWLVPGPPFACQHPQCAGDGGPVRAAYLPGSHRRMSWLLCQDCAPEENPPSAGWA